MRCGKSSWIGEFQLITNTADRWDVRRRVNGRELDRSFVAETIGNSGNDFVSICHGRDIRGRLWRATSRPIAELKESGCLLPQQKDGPEKPNLLISEDQNGGVRDKLFLS